MTLYQFPAIASGDRVITSTLTGIETAFIAKGNTTPRTSNSILDDPDLAFPLVAGGLYFVEFGVYYNGLAAANITTKWNVVSGASGLRAVLGPGSTATDGSADNISGRFGVHGFTTGVTYSCARNGSNQQWAYENSLVQVGATAGNATLQWGQAASNATATNVTGSSWGRCQRLA